MAATKVKPKHSRSKLLITKEEIEVIIARVGLEGISLKASYEASPKKVCYMTLRDRIHRDKDLSLLYTHAREEYSHRIVERLHSIPDTEEDVARARLKCDNIKWEACKVLPKFYGDRKVIAGDSEAPLQIQQIERTIISSE